ncbi:MAG TPA: hypothetical protein VFA28_02015 [Bryobacteraceae bacterium]|jgi:hypothetical protein|nr:hypothetical protein [Bryobacteraceae bacterium]
MGLGELTKEFAKQALGNQVKDVVDALRPPELSKISDALGASHPAAPPQQENPCAVILGQLQAMQKALKDEEELVVLAAGASETLRVLEVFAPSWQVVVLTGIDADKNITRLICPVHSLQLTCKVMKTPPDVKATRIRFIAPRHKSE